MKQSDITHLFSTREDLLMNYDSKSFFIRKDLHSGTIDMALMDNTTLPNTRKIKKRGQVW